MLAEMRADCMDAGDRAKQERLPNPLPNGELKPIHAAMTAYKNCNKFQLSHYLKRNQRLIAN